MATGLVGVATVALLLGARHATEPDHLTAVATLALDRRDAKPARIATLGLAWGLGHATTLLALGVPMILLGRLLPGDVQRGIESLVGVLIAALAVRLLLRWRRGILHVHPHAHAGRWHVHPHVHDAAPATHRAADHRHRHARSLATPLASFALGLVHGVGGSAGAGLLLIAAEPTAARAAATLVVFALAASGAMAALSGIFGWLLGRPPVARRCERLIPWAAAASLVFGVVYALGAWM